MLSSLRNVVRLSSNTDCWTLLQTRPLTWKSCLDKIVSRSGCSHRGHDAVIGTETMLSPSGTCGLLCATHVPNDHFTLLTEDLIISVLSHHFYIIHCDNHSNIIHFRLVVFFLWFVTFVIFIVSTLAPHSQLAWEVASERISTASAFGRCELWGSERVTWPNILHRWSILLTNVVGGGRHCEQYGGKDFPGFSKWSACASFQKIPLTLRESTKCLYVLMRFLASP